MSASVDDRRRIREEKRELRRELRRRIGEMTEEKLLRESEAAAEALFTLEEWNRARSILVFVSMKGELQTDGIIERAIKEEKQIALPKMHGEVMEFHRVGTGGISSSNISSVDGLYKQLERHPYGVLEPPDSSPVFSVYNRRHTGGNKATEGKKGTGNEDLLPALVVTPGLAFDSCGNRLGRGKAFYDRWFAEHERELESGAVVPVAIGFTVQLVERVPVGERDRRIPLLDIAGTILRTE